MFAICQSVAVSSVGNRPCLTSLETMVHIEQPGGLKHQGMSVASEPCVNGLQASLALRILKPCDMFVGVRPNMDRPLIKAL